MGSSAIATVTDHEHALHTLTDAYRENAAAINALAADHATFKKSTRDLRELDLSSHLMILDSVAAVQRCVDRYREPLQRGFLGRLRWLFTGK